MYKMAKQMKPKVLALSSKLAAIPTFIFTFTVKLILPPTSAFSDSEVDVVAEI